MPEVITAGQTGNFVLGNDGTRIYLAGADGNLRVYNAQSGELLATWDIGTNLGGIDISPDGSFLLVTEQEPVEYVVAPGGWPENSTTSAVYKVDTATGAVQTLTYQS